MTEPLSSWPPPPNVTPPLAAHDEFLAACVRSSTLKPPVSRLRLARDLHQETGKDLRSSMAIVNNFRDRHLIAMPATGILPWLIFIPILTNFAAILVMYLGQEYLRGKQSAAVTHLEKLAFRNERVHLDLVVAGVLIVSIILMATISAYRLKKTRADAAEAVAKFGGDGVRMK